MIKRITKFTKIAVISVSVIAVIVAVSVSLIYYFYPEESVLKIIKNRSETLLNRKIDIDSLHYSPRGIVIYGVTIHDKSDDGTEPVLIKAEEAVITFSLFSIIKNDFKLRSIYFNGLMINVAFDKDGKSNLEKLAEEIRNRTESGGGDKSVQLSKITLNECRISLINPPKFIKPLEGEYLINSSIRIKDNKYFAILNTRIILPQKRGLLYPELMIDTSENFGIRGRVKIENTSLLWVYKFADSDPELPFNVVNGQVNDFEITKDHVKGYAKATSSLKNSKNILLAEGSCTVDLKDINVALKDVKGKINSSTVNVDSMLISTDLGKIVKFSFSDISFQLSDARCLLESIPAGLSGSARGSLSFDGNMYNGRLDASDISYRDNTELFRDLNTTLEINNNIIKKENIPATVFGNSSTVSIATTDNRFKNFYVSVNFEKMNVNNIHFDRESGNGSKINIPVNITGKININEFVYDDIVFKNTKANLTVSGSVLKINNFNTSVLSGSIYGLGAIDLSGKSPSVQTSLKFENIKIHDIKFKNENMNSRLFGFAEGTANLSLLIKDNAAETIKGNATFTITKGKVVDTGVQNGLIIFLSELRYKLKNLEFNKVYGNIGIDGNNFTINSFIFNSEDLRLTMSGRIDRDLTAKDMNMKLEFNNHFIKDIPRPAVAVFNQYLSGKWYVVPFTLIGNITESKNLKMLKKDQ